MSSNFIGGALSGFAGQSSKSKQNWKTQQKESNSRAPASSGANDEGGQAVGSYKRGGKVKRTGKARVHKGERVLTAKQAKRYEKRGAKRG